MNTNPDQIQLLIQNARAALRRGDGTEARRLAEQVSRLAPDLEDAWLILTAASGPRESVQFARRALEINPDSQRARKALNWARSRPGAEEPEETAPTPRLAPGEVEVSAPEASKPEKRRSWLFPILLVVLVCAVIGLAGWSVSRSFARASTVKNVRPSAPASAPEKHFAAADIRKPTYTPEWTFTPTFTYTPTFTFTPSLPPTLESTNTPLPTDTPTATDTPGVMEAYIVPDTPTSIPPTAAPYVAPTQAAAAPPATSGGSSPGNGVHWIDINLSTQHLFAYEGDTIVNVFLISSGVAATPTVTGTYHIYARYLYADMHGPGYYLPDVPYTMYFYKSYGIHGTYWHNNFGTPMSHGCVNLSIPDAEWLYYWSNFGTTVKIHY